MDTSILPVINSLYIHYPFCSSKCGYCGFYSLPTNSTTILNEKERLYFSKIQEEFLFYYKSYNFSELETIYIGGGNPSLNPEFIRKITDFLKYHINFLKIKELTVECNPTNISEDFINNCRSSGVTRLSLGVQSFSKEALNYSHRPSPDFTELINIFNLISDKFPDLIVSIDLINGLPLTIINEETEKLNYLLNKFNIIKHISLYDLSIDEGSYFSKNNIAGLDENTKEKNELAYKKVLQKNGFKQYEISNYCRGKNKSLHNYNYWKYKNYVGLGPAAHGTIDGVRIENHPDIDKYINSKEINDTHRKTSLNINEQLEEYLLMGLRLTEGISLVDFKKRFSIDFQKTFMPIIEKHSKNKNLKIQNNKIIVSKRGQKILNKILIDFFTHIDYFDKIN